MSIDTLTDVEATEPEGERVDLMSPERLTDQLVRILREQIEAGTLTGRLPSETALREYHNGISRGTVRRALQSLADDGLIFGAQGRGWFVRERP